MSSLEERCTMLQNRLRKRARALKGWAKQKDLEAYRLYDRDIPEIPCAVDRYKDHAHLAFFKRATPVEENEIAPLRRAVAEGLQIPVDNVAVKVREKKDRQSQYNRKKTSTARILVREQGLVFSVNLYDYLDTGLFLDHRILRAKVREEAEDKRVLNLFSYTGAFGIYALAGGASEVVQVDASPVYNTWAEANVKHNEFDPRRHRTVKDDAIRYLRETKDRFDLVVVDPPTFSHGKRVERSFDIKPDHIGLLQSVHRVLDPGGVAYFSTNAKGFQLGELGVFETIERLDNTVPRDFISRHSHRAWRLSKAALQ